MSNPSGTPAASAHPLPSYLQADHLGPWGNYLQQVDRVTPYLGSLAMSALTGWRWSPPCPMCCRNRPCVSRNCSNRDLV